MAEEIARGFLISRGADVDANDNRGHTALTWAVESCSAKAVELVLRNGADVNARDDHGETALMKAERLGKMEAAALLRKHGAR